ncbi:MAG TPA: T9SS type A sorting domain-containing protein, partial [Candidatus Krumholzibacteria bacterium]|nr:T9SS type A sorting domain-containing protein [Candidatus Krumholzibacteria bacterium]
SSTDAARAAADDFYHAWRDTHLANDGCYREGTLYIGWSLRNLIYYFAARKRFDGVDYALDPSIRAVERWVPYELDTGGGGRVNNIQDQTDYFRPLARHTTYWAWAQSEWGSHLAAYMWDHSAGAYGKDMLDENDKASTVLWHRNLTPVNPGTVLPRSHVWEDRGLYYFRTGWPDGGTSGDVVFSFYSGEFRGGHAQEDQNQFTLSAYGEKLVLDNGAGSWAKQSEAHNIIRIDGNGEHNAGSSIGTDGKITQFVTTDYADIVRGDATLAYSTHSPYNDAGVPYAWSNWSWGYAGANPVEHALRTIVAVHGDNVPPYFVMRDDIKKDSNSHRYDWCMHAPSSAVIDTTTGALSVTTAAASLRILCLQPARTALSASIAPFDNANEDPNSQLLMVGTRAVDPYFTLVLLPLPAQGTAPAVTRTPLPNGARLTLDWGNAIVDDIRMRTPYSPGGLAADDGVVYPNLVTDAEVSMVRSNGPAIAGFTLVNATYLSAAGILIAAVDDAPASLVFDGSNVHLSRPDADFRVLAGLVDGVYYRGQPVPSHLEGSYRVRTQPTGVENASPRTLHLRTYPNPFNPQVQISFVNPSRGMVNATVHDVSGRRVATLAARVLEAGSHTLVWNGEDEKGSPSASGVYFLRLRAGAQSATTKLVLVR